MHECMQAFNRTLEGPNVYRDWQQCWQHVGGDVDSDLPIAERDLTDMQVCHTCSDHVLRPLVFSAVSSCSSGLH